MRLTLSRLEAMMVVRYAVRSDWIWSIVRLAKAMQAMSMRREASKDIGAMAWRRENASILSTVATKACTITKTTQSLAH